MRDIFKVIILFTLGFVALIGQTAAFESSSQNPEIYLEGTVVEVIAENEIAPNIFFQELRILITAGTLETQEILAKVTPAASNFQSNRYVVADKVMVTQLEGLEGDSLFYVTDYLRRPVLFWLFVLFVGVVLIVSRIWGLLSILGLVFSFFIIFKLVLPNILAGHNPILVAVAGALLIAPVTFFASHGINKKTAVALVSTIVALIITALLAAFFVDAANLTGFASEEAWFLQLAKGSINIKGILLAGIIIGTLGILDDATVSQASIVAQLKHANPNLSYKELYQMAMHVGHDHIAATINTLVLVYTGAALPLLLLFVNNPLPFAQVVNNEIIADEIIRTLVGSIGLVLSIPITTALAAYVMPPDDNSSEGFYHSH